MNYYDYMALRLGAVKQLAPAPVSIHYPFHWRSEEEILMVWDAEQRQRWAA